MPRTKLQESVSKRKHPPVDKVKGLILERVNAMELTYSDISKGHRLIAGCNRQNDETTLLRVGIRQTLGGSQGNRSRH